MKRGCMKKLDVAMLLIWAVHHFHHALRPKYIWMALITCLSNPGTFILTGIEFPKLHKPKLFLSGPSYIPFIFILSVT